MQVATDKSKGARRKSEQKLTRAFFLSCLVGFVLLGVFLIVAMIVPLCVDNLSSKLLTAKLAFASLGLLFGILEVFLGILLALIGVIADYDVDASIGRTRLKLVSASPGILLIIVGNLLFGFSLMRQAEVNETLAEGSQQAATSTANPPQSKESEGLAVPRLNTKTGPE